MKKQKFLLIGWDAADWKAIHPLIDQGLMPNLEKMINEGVMGNLATLDPPLSPMLWSSIGTGKRPYKHGIHGFTEPQPDGKGVRPVLNTSRKCKAIWNILTQENYKTHVVGWWPSHPAEPINGIAISNFYQKAHFPKEGETLTNWPMMKNTVHPPEKSDLFAQMRVHPNELTAAHIYPFVPNGEKIDQTNKAIQKRMTSLRKIIADCSTIHAAATYILEFEEWDFMGVYYDAIDHFGHGFMKFHPPKRDHIRQDQYDAWYYVNTAGYRYHDMMLGRLLALAGEDTTVMLISDHGFHPDHLRPKAIPKEPAGPALEHSPYGIVVMKGPGIKKDSTVYGASLLDVTPTILTSLGLPVGEDMDGRVLKTVFKKEPEIKTIDSWENVPGECGMHPESMRNDPYVDKEALDQLVELGYIEKPDEDASKAVKKTVNENNFWLARAYMDGNKYKEALPMLESLFEDHPDQLRYGFRLVRCYQALNKVAEAKAALKILKTHVPEKGSKILFLEGSVLMIDDQPEEALQKFIEAEVKSPNNPTLFMFIAQAYSKLKKWKDAERSYTKALEIDSKSQVGYFGRGLCLHKQGQYEDAIEDFVKAIGLLYYFPQAHYYLGESLYAIGEYEAASKAFETCLEMNQKAHKARHKLNQTYDVHMGMPDKSAELSSDWLSKTEKEIIIVSGLPRSGTSMMMQMLDKGGVTPFTDKERKPDENNPKGYYEHEAVKSLGADKSFLKNIEEGQVVKIIAQLLSQLPLKYRYKIVFMERDLDEIVQSQSRMLDRLAEEGKKQKQRNPQRLKKAFEQALKRVRNWSTHMANVEILYVNYAQTVDNPTATANQLKEFLGDKIDTNKMISAVDKSLYREKAPSKTS